MNVLRGTCSRCSNPRRPGQRYCWQCHAEYRRRYKHAGLSVEAKKKANARRYVNAYVERGNVIRGLCEVCHSPDTQPHHENYDQPLKVRWLCREHRLHLEGKKMRKAVVERYA